ncbi:MAG: hypothetical protein HONDAALG_01286 [Gammaproteobacteria bacterium]|nr:hypothetical protein [Gammaproteobacteria bacterium]
MSDYATLVATLEGFRERAQGRALTLGEVLDSIEEASFCFFAIILVLPFLTPVSLGPLATAGGLVFAAMGWQMWRGHKVPVLPQRVRRIEVGAQTWEVTTRVCLKILGWSRKITRPRYTRLVTGALGRRNSGLVLMAAGLLMAIPFFGLPFNNALPGLAILFVCVAELEQDGLMLFGALFWLAVTVVYFSIVLTVAAVLGDQAWTYLGNLL